MMLADNRKATLQAIHTDAVNKAVKDQKKNIVLDGVVVYPLPCLWVGESDHPAFGPSITPAGFVHKSRGDNVVRMWVQLKRCVSCVWMLQRGHCDDGCVLVSTLCKYDM